MLHNFIKEDTRLIFTKEYFIVDSEMVRAMIQKKLCGVNIFAAIHTGEIPTCTCPEDWTCAKSKWNTADWTRCEHPIEIGENSSWQKGPYFL